MPLAVLQDREQLLGPAVGVHPARVHARRLQPAGHRDFVAGAVDRPLRRSAPSCRRAHARPVRYDCRLGGAGVLHGRSTARYCRSFAQAHAGGATQYEALGPRRPTTTPWPSDTPEGDGKRAVPQQLPRVPLRRTPPHHRRVEQGPRPQAGDQGYRELPTIETAKYGITCQACHTTHSTGAKTDRGRVERRVQHAASRAPAKDLCVQCHNAELADNPTPGVAVPGQEVHHPMKEMMERHRRHEVPQGSPSWSTRASASPVPHAADGLQHLRRQPWHGRQPRVPDHPADGGCGLGSATISLCRRSGWLLCTPCRTSALAASATLVPATSRPSGCRTP